MEEYMVKILKRGKTTALLLALFLSLSFRFADLSCTQSNDQFQASIWVDGECGSSHTEGDSITIHFIVEAKSPSECSSNVRVSIIDYYPNDAGSQYLIQNEICTINTICRIKDTVDCSSGEGIEMLELIAEVYTSTGNVVVKDTCSFYVHCITDSTPPNISQVELVQPVNTTLSTRIPTFTWRIPLTDYQDVANWTLEYASDSQFQQNRRTISGLTNLSTTISGNNAIISYTPPSAQALTNGTWFWHVSAVDAAGNQSAFTAAESFVVNVEPPPPAKVYLVSPPNGFTDAPKRPTFSWKQVEGATSYHLQVDDNQNFSSPVIDEDNIVTTSYMAPADLEPGTYYWRVTSNAPNAEWSDVWWFTISEAPLTGEYELTVNVSDVSGDPISGAAVTLTKDSTTAGTGSTDASGTATIRNLEEGSYILEVSATGYTSYSNLLTLSVNTTTDVTLYRKAVIHGYVYYDNTQNPAANEAVRVYDSETQLQVVSGITDANGYFIVDNIAGNRTYFIVVENYNDQKKQGIVPVDTPTTANVLTVIIKTEGEIIGVVQGEEGSPLAGAKVTLRDAQGQFVNSTSTTNIGAFTFKAAPGRYYVEVTVFGFEDYKGDIFTVEHREVEDLGLITLLSKTGTLIVTVQGKGVPLDATVTVKNEAGAIVDTITVTGGTASTEIPVGVYSLKVDANDYNPQTIDVSIKSGTTTSHDFILVPASGLYNLYVTDIEGIPISEAKVFIDGRFRGTTDETGTLVINDVSPEGHLIGVVKEGYTDYRKYQTANPDETVVLEVIMEKSQSIVPYILILIVVAALGGVALVKYMKSKPPTISKRRTEELSYVMVCPYCRNRIEKDRIICPYCGANLDDTRIYDDDTRIY